MGHKNRTSLLAWCLAALFLMAQTHASAHTHDDSQANAAVAECTICIIGGHLDDVTPPDLDVCVTTPKWVLLTPLIEIVIERLFLADANARAPPIS